MSRFQKRLDNLGRIAEREHISEEQDSNVIDPTLGETDMLGNDGVQEGSELGETLPGNSRYSISLTGAVAIDIPSWLMRHRFDPAIQVILHTICSSSFLLVFDRVLIQTRRHTFSFD